MLSTLKDLFTTITRPAPAGVGHTPHDLQLATAVLLVEVMCADASLGDGERAAVLGTLQRRFALQPDELARLMELAQVRARAAHDLHSFTSALNAAYSEAEKIAVVEAMWEVAYADSHLAAHEQHILWRVADLLHVPHGAYINAKMRARDAAGA
jgi:uncharacterized tellurite resistance protein B-like protein